MLLSVVIIELVGDMALKFTLIALAHDFELLMFWLLL